MSRRRCAGPRVSSPDVARAAASRGRFSLVLTPSSRPSVDDADSWGVVVLDFQDGRVSQYTLQVDSVLPVDGVIVDENVPQAVSVR